MMLAARSLPPLRAARGRPPLSRGMDNLMIFAIFCVSTAQPPDLSGPPLQPYASQERETFAMIVRTHG